MEVTLKELYEMGTDFRVTLNPKGTDFIDFCYDGEVYMIRYNLDKLQEFFRRYDWDMSRIKTEVL